MQNHQFDLQAGESLRIGSYTVTLLEVENGSAVLEIEGPDGEIQVEPVSFSETEVEEENAVLV